MFRSCFKNVCSRYYYYISINSEHPPIRGNEQITGRKKLPGLFGIKDFGFVGAHLQTQNDAVFVIQYDIIFFERVQFSLASVGPNEGVLPRFIDFQSEQLPNRVGHPGFDDFTQIRQPWSMLIGLSTPHIHGNEIN